MPYTQPTNQKHIAMDLTKGTDVRGDEALFIENSRFLKEGWEVDEDTKEALKKLGSGPTFFRVIYDGEQTSSHGWINLSTGEVEQWGLISFDNCKCKIKHIGCNKY